MILIVDDDPVFLENATEALSTDHERVLCARSANPAIELIRTLGLELEAVLVDLSLDDGNGFDLISSIRKLDESLPIIAISGVFSDATLQSSKVLGAKEALRKPIDNEWNATIDRLKRKPAAPAQD